MIVENTFKSRVANLRSWFLDQSVPFWSQFGVDHSAGGFFEKLDSIPPFSPTAEPRRARLVARQIYFFAVAESLGWKGPADDIINHGFEFLNQYLVSSSGRISASCSHSGEIIDGRQHLYDVAFVLLALSMQAMRVSEPSVYEELAIQIVTQLVTNSYGGYIDEVTPSMQCANPHMHLFEAFLAWTTATDLKSQFWIERTELLAKLACSSLIQPDIGVLPEHFDHQWKPIKTNGFYVIEPGHQFEWSWLLARWSSITGNMHTASSAFRLCTLAEDYGINTTRNTVVDCFDQDLVIRDRTSRLWQQAERVKAWHFHVLLDKHVECETYLEGSIRSLSSFLDGPFPGLWYDEMSPEGIFVPTPIKASSGYHIACALDSLVSSQGLSS